MELHAAYARTAAEYGVAILPFKNIIHL
jgi:hypothetical protein